MEPVFKILVALVMIPFTLFAVKVFVLWPNVVAQVSADGTTGPLNIIKAALHYLTHGEELKTIYIRDGKFTHRPLSVATRNEGSATNDVNQE